MTVLRGPDGVCRSGPYKTQDRRCPRHVGMHACSIQLRALSLASFFLRGFVLLTILPCVVIGAVADPPIWRGLAAAKPPRRRDYPPSPLPQSWPAAPEEHEGEEDEGRTVQALFFTRVLPHLGLLLGLYTRPHEAHV